MNTEIAKILKGKISGLNFIDRISGAVRPLVKIDIAEGEGDSDTRVRKVFPVSCEVTHQQCQEESRYKDLVPNDEFRTIIYFEDKGVSFKERKGQHFTFTSRLRLVGWINLKMFDTIECSVSALIIANLIKQLPQSHFNDGMFSRIQVGPIEEAPKTSDIFSQYTYSEETNQYLLYPYDYFALDIETEFSIHESCITDLQLKAADCQPI